ncbi:MAG: serpin family protein, partial [Planctomycetota bacterium]
IAREKDLTVLELPYTGARLSMLVLLPNDREGLREVEKALSRAKIDLWLEGLQEQDVRVMLPRFTLDSRMDLGKTLKAMGMSEAFNKKADFSGMTRDDGLFISHVVHHAVIEVDEKGTEATGAAAVTLKRKGGAFFNADHPFLFLIRDQRTGSLLFIGRVENPQA